MLPPGPPALLAAQSSEYGSSSSSSMLFVHHRVQLEIRDFELCVPKFVLARDRILVSCRAIGVTNALLQARVMMEVNHNTQKI